MATFDSGAFDSGAFDTGGGSGTNVAPGAASVTITGIAPAVTQSSAGSVSPETGQLALACYAPTLTQTAHQSTSPAVGSVSLTGYAPSVTQSANQALTTAAGVMTLTGHAPTVSQTVLAGVYPSAGAIALTGYAPIIAQTANLDLILEAGALALTGHGPTVAQAPVASDPRFARPASTVSAGAWLPSSGSDLAAMLDEPSADSADYIYTNSASTAEIKLNSVVDPSTSSGQIVRYQAWSPEGNGLVVTLKQGVTTIASWTHLALPVNPLVYAQVLTAAQCNSITDYTDLRLEFTAA